MTDKRQEDLFNLELKVDKESENKKDLNAQSSSIIQTNC